MSLPTWRPSASKTPQPAGGVGCPVSSPRTKRPLPSGSGQIMPLTSRPGFPLAPGPWLARWIRISSVGAGRADRVHVGAPQPVALGGVEQLAAVGHGGRRRQSQRRDQAPRQDGERTHQRVDSRGPVSQGRPRMSRSAHRAGGARDRLFRRSRSPILLGPRTNAPSSMARGGPMPFPMLRAALQGALALAFAAAPPPRPPSRPSRTTSARKPRRPRASCSSTTSMRTPSACR